MDREYYTYSQALQLTGLSMEDVLYMCANGQLHAFVITDGWFLVPAGCEDGEKIKPSYGVRVYPIPGYFEGMGREPEGRLKYLDAPNGAAIEALVKNDQRKTVKPKFGLDDLRFDAREIEPLIKEVDSSATPAITSQLPTLYWYEKDAYLYEGLEGQVKRTRRKRDEKASEVIRDIINAGGVRNTAWHYFDNANKIARAVAAKHPEGIIGVYSYSGYSHPPSFDLEPNIYVQIATRFNRSPLGLDERLKAFGKRAKGGMGIRGYT